MFQTSSPADKAYMRVFDSLAVDLTPPDFAEGLDDWSSGDGTPESATYEKALNVRILPADANFGTCLEMHKTEAVQRLRYMAELPIMHGRFLEVRTRVKAMQGIGLGVRIAAWPGGLNGRHVADLAAEAPVIAIGAIGSVEQVRAVIGSWPADGVDLVWDERVLYAHVGLDLVGPVGGVVRVERFAVEDVTARYSA